MDPKSSENGQTPRRAGLGKTTEVPAAPAETSLATERAAPASAPNKPTERAAPAAFQRTEFCSNCRAGAFEPNVELGRCRARPPRMVILAIREKPLGEGLESTTLSDWPPVVRDQWCLEWKPLPSAVQ